MFCLTKCFDFKSEACALAQKNFHGHILINMESAIFKNNALTIIEQTQIQVNDINFTA